MERRADHVASTREAPPQEREDPDSGQAENNGRASSAPTPSARNRWWRRPWVVGLIVVAAIGAVAYGVRYAVHAWHYESTDDAFLDAHIVQISPRVAGHVMRVLVDENQEVEKGQLLAELDPKDFQTALDQAEASLQAAIARQKAAQVAVGLTRTTATAEQGAAQAAVQQAEAAAQAAGAQVAVAKSELDQAQTTVDAVEAAQAEAAAAALAAESQSRLANSELQRAQRLMQSNAISQAEYDQATAAAQSAAANLEAARKKVDAVRAQVAQAQSGVRVAQDTLKQDQEQAQAAQAKVAQAKQQLAGTSVVPQRVQTSQAQAQASAKEIEQLQAAVERAKLQLSYAKVHAPSDGRIARRAVEPGDYVQPGQQLMALVMPDIWVTANFKETQLTHMQPGQPAWITVDAYPGRVFHGHVDSIQPGTGAQFSLLPPENATGNYVKVVQRVPVKIVFDDPPDLDHPLAPGMSVVPEVKVR